MVEDLEKIKKKKLKLKLLKFEALKNLYPDTLELPEKFTKYFKCFKNDSLVQTVKSVLLALRNKRNVIIVGNDETGLTQIAEWCSQYFNKELSSKKKMKLLFVFAQKIWNVLILLEHKK